MKDRKGDQRHRDDQHRHVPSRKQRTAEQQVEHHLVVERPSQAVERTRAPGGPRIRDEEIRPESERRAGIRGRKSTRHDVKQHHGGHRPVERHDADDAAEHEGTERALTPEQALRRIDHHEA